VVTTSITQEIVAHLHRCKSRCQRQNRSQTRRRRETTASLIVRAAKQPAMPITVCSPCVYTVHSIQWRIPGGGGGSLGSHESPPRPRASHHCIELPSITLKAKFHYAIKVADPGLCFRPGFRQVRAGSCVSATSSRPSFVSKAGRRLQVRAISICPGSSNLVADQFAQLAFDRPATRTRRSASRSAT